jgi:hypothetical protein
MRDANTTSPGDTTPADAQCGNPKRIRQGARLLVRNPSVGDASGFALWDRSHRAGNPTERATRHPVRVRNRLGVYGNRRRLDGLHDSRRAAAALPRLGAGQDSDGSRPGSEAELPSRCLVRPRRVRLGALTPNPSPAPAGEGSQLGAVAQRRRAPQHSPAPVAEKQEVRAVSTGADDTPVPGPRLPHPSPAPVGEGQGVRAVTIGADDTCIAGQGLPHPSPAPVGKGRG